MFDEDSNQISYPTQLSTTSMVDVIFILLAFFMVVSQLKEHNISLKLATVSGGKSAQPKKEEKNHTLTIQIDKHSQLFLNQNKLSLAQLEKRLKSISQKNGFSPQKWVVYLRSDRSAKTAPLIAALNALKKYRFSNIRIAVMRTQPNPNGG
ncbi:MAG: biopolymer transporter ExbD [Planctomycetota bacterium]|nr:MAG: biopolymer transporter ExbD [Planctomycetota bacterium]